MNELLPFFIACAAGTAAGFIFFGGLKLTLKRIPGMKNPALFVLLSFWLRLIITAGMTVILARLFGWPPVLLFVGALICVKLGFVISEKRRVNAEYKPNA